MQNNCNLQLRKENGLTIFYLLYYLKCGSLAFLIRQYAHLQIFIWRRHAGDTDQTFACQLIDFGLFQMRKLFGFIH